MSGFIPIFKSGVNIYTIGCFALHFHVTFIECQRMVPSFIHMFNISDSLEDSVQYCFRCLTDVIGNAVKIVVRARILYTLVSISSSFSTIPFFSIKKRRPSGTPVVALCCLLPAIMQGMGISDLPKEKRFPGSFFFFWGVNLLVNQRGRVWEGNRKRLISPQTKRIDFSLGVKMPIVPCFFPVSAIIPVL